MTASEEGSLFILPSPSSFLLTKRRDCFRSSINVAPISVVNSATIAGSKGVIDSVVPESRSSDNTRTIVLKAIEPKEERPDSVAGVLVRAKLDPDHWLNAGMGDTVHALIRGRAIYTPLTLDKGQNPAVLMGADELVAGGYLWEENRKQLAYKPLTMVQSHGRGLVIGFAADPNYRAYLDGLNVIFLNAVFRGPARARPPVLRR